jgi:predicted amidohydrolase
VNRVGSEAKQDFYGRSFCISPEGELLDKPTGMKDGIALVEIDLKNIDKARKEWPFLRDRKPDDYKEILQDVEHGPERIE